MKRKLTAIYRDSWESGGYMHVLIKCRKFEQRDGETVKDACQREGIADAVEYIFAGHVKHLGEEGEDA